MNSAHRFVCIQQIDIIDVMFSFSLPFELCVCVFANHKSSKVPSNKSSKKASLGWLLRRCCSQCDAMVLVQQNSASNVEHTKHILQHSPSRVTLSHSCPFGLVLIRTAILHMQRTDRHHDLHYTDLCDERGKWESLLSVDSFSCLDWTPAFFFYEGSWIDFSCKRKSRKMQKEW